MCLVSKRSTSNITAITTFLPQAKHQHNSIHLREAYENIDALFDNNYVFSSDITNRKSINLGYTQVCTLGDFLGGLEGSLLDLFGGEYKWNNFNVSLLKIEGRNERIASSGATIYQAMKKLNQVKLR